MTTFYIVAPSSAVRGTTISEIEIDGPPEQNIMSAWEAWEERTRDHVSYGVREWYPRRGQLELHWDGGLHSYGAEQYLKVGEGLLSIPPQQTTLPFEESKGD